MHCHCARCLKDLEIEVDFDGIRNREYVAGGQRCENCFAITCAACIDGGWCPACVARDEKIAALTPGVWS